MPGRSPLMSTHRVDEDDSKRDLEMSVTPGGPTRPHGRVEAASGESNAPDMLHIDQRWWESDTEPRNAKTKPLESIEDERAHLDSATTISRGATSISGNRSSAAPRPFTGHHTDSNSFVYQSFGIHSSDSIFHLLGQTLTVICLPFRV